MKKIFLLLIIFTLSYGVARADVRSEISCYGGYVPRPYGPLSKLVTFVLHTYVDTDLNKEIGAFVQYNASKDSIPLVYSKYIPTDTDDPGLGNYEIHRFEVVKQKITGEYVFTQTGAGIKQGKYVTYTNFRTGKKILLTHTADDESGCKIAN